MDLVSRFQEAYHNRHQVARGWKREGRKVFGYLYSAVPEELIYAAGILPVQLIESEERDTVVKGKTILPDFFCDYAQSCLGQGLEGIYNYLDGLVISDACATLRGFVNAWKIHINTPYYYYLTPPFEATEQAKVYYTKELTRFKRSIEDYSGKELTPESLGSAIEVYNENRRLLSTLYELRLQDKPPISGSQVLEIIKAGLVIPKEEHNLMLRELLQGLSGKRGEGEAKSRLLVSMFIFEDCATEEVNILELIEEMGGTIVFDDVCMGLRYFWEPVEPKADPVEALVERYLGRVPIGSRYPLETRMERLLAQAKKYRVKGAIFAIPKYCDPYLLEHPYVEKRFREEGIPTLMLETTESMPPQQVRVRIQAFMEMLGSI